MSGRDEGARGGAFGPDELIPSSGAAGPDESDETVQRVALRMALYEEIFVRTDRHDAVHAHFARVLARGLAVPGGPHLGGRVLGPSGSGKTTAARNFKTAYEARGLHSPGEQPVVLVPLERASTSRRFFSALLSSCGDGFAGKGSEEELQARSEEALRRLSVRLIVVDEVQHLRFRSTERNDTTDTLKRVLDSGHCPIVFCGTDDAADFLNANKQLANRLMPPCDMPPLVRSDKDDRRVFKDYVTRLDAALVEKGLTTLSSGFADKRVLSCLFAVSGRVLGRVSNLVRVALEYALSRDANAVDVCDLVRATRTWAIAQEFIDYCPWTLGVRRSAPVVKDQR